jgi:transposase
MIPFKLRPREYHQLDELARCSHDAASVQRAHALLALHEGLSAGEIADLLDVSRQTIYNWAEAFLGRGNLNLAQRLLDAPRSGRPASVLGIIDPLIDAVIDDDPRDYGYRSTVWTAPLLQRYVEEAHAIVTSRRSVSRALSRLSIRWKRPRHQLTQRLETWRQAKGGSKTA